VDADYYFKLDPNIRNASEVYFGKMEIEGLMGQEVQPIKHFYDVLKNPPMSYFDNDDVRIQDYLLNLRTVYGGIQGYHAKKQLMDLSQFVERLAYTREIYAIVKMNESIESIKKKIFPFGVEGTNFQVWTKATEDGYCLLRIITNIFFLEQLNNVILCSAGKTIERQKARMKENIDRLIYHIMENIRIYVPKFPRDANWKEFEDFVDEPNEITLYLTQFYGPPYKAKFHPRMIRALLNFAEVTPEEKTGDFMLGSGTLAVESVLSGIDTKGSDINPLTKPVVKAKIEALSLKPDLLLEQIKDFFKNLPHDMEVAESSISPYALKLYREKKHIVNQCIFLNRHIRKVVKVEYLNFFLCALAHVISAAFKKRNKLDVVYELENELKRMWKIIYSLDKIKFLHLPLGKAEVEIGDIRKIGWIPKDSVDLIITSPPYSTAIDYVKNDLAQLLLLELINDPKELDENMMGTQRKTSDIETLSKDITLSRPLISGEPNRFQKLPKEAQKYILDLKNEGNMKTALRCYKFLYDMWDSIFHMHKILRNKGKCILIIGNNNFTVGGKKVEFRNGDFLEEIALNKEIGFSKWRRKIVREYSKSSYGTILKEDIIFLEKV